MTAWQEVMLNDVVSILGDGLHGTPEYDDNGEYYFINGNNLKNGKIVIKESTRRASKEEFDKYKKNLNDRTILVSINGTIGNVAAYNNEKCFLGKSACYFNVIDNVEKDFIFYVATSNQFQTYISEFANGTTIKNVPLKAIREYSFFLPEHAEQKSIAAVLSSLDDKIDLLHRQNKTLESMSETLFRQWLVEEAQEDWEEIPFEQFFDFMEGPGIRNWQYTESGTPFINIRLISDGDIDITKASFVSNEEANGKYSHFRLKEGDMIVSTSGTLGKNAIVRSYHLPLLLNTSVIRFRPRDGRSYSFAYQYLNSRLFQEHLVSAASGSVQANFGPTHLKQMILSKPPQDVLDQYLLQADRLYEKLRVNQAQIKTLEKLRDTLLPKLMSGEVRVAA